MLSQFQIKLNNNLKNKMKNIKTLKFWAPWCKPCTALGVQLEGIKMDSYNIDEEEGSKMAAKFRIRNIPMLVFIEVDGKGNETEIHRHPGVISKQSYLDTVDALANNKVNPDYQELVEKVGSPVIEESSKNLQPVGTKK